MVLILTQITLRVLTFIVYLNIPLQKTGSKYIDQLLLSLCTQVTKDANIEGADIHCLPQYPITKKRDQST